MLYEYGGWSSGRLCFLLDAVVYRDTRDSHVLYVRSLFEYLVCGPIRLTKKEFAHAIVTYIWHVVGQGQVCYKGRCWPKNSKKEPT